MSFKEFGQSKAVFINQDEGMFVAFPMTFDDDALTLEKEVIGGRTYVKEGSVVKEGSIVRGITAERYDITEGPTAGRVVLEGYAWAHRLTAGALAAASSLPKIVIFPFNRKIEVNLVEAPTGLKAVLHLENAEWNEDVDTTHFTVTVLTVSAVDILENGDLEITFTGAGTGSLTAIASGALAKSAGGTLSGLPISITTKA